MLRQIRSKKHEGSIFLLDTDSGDFIAKVYNIKGNVEIAKAFTKAFKELREGVANGA